MGQVTQCDGRSISSISRGQQLGKPEQGLHHLTDLVLTGGAVAGDGLLDLVGRVLDDIAASSNRFGHDDSAGHADPHCGADVLLEQHPFDRNDVGTQFGEQRPDLELELSEPLR